jgi:hypothetical protein
MPVLILLRHRRAGSIEDTHFLASFFTLPPSPWVLPICSVIAASEPIFMKGAANTAWRQTATTGPTGALSTLSSADLAERRFINNGIRAVASQPNRPKAASAGVYDDATSRWTDCIQSVGSYFLDRLDISFCLCPLSFLIVRSCLARTVVSRLPRNSCKGVQRYHYPSLVRPEWRLRISEIRNRQSAPRVIPNLAKPLKSFLSEESVPLKN